MEPKSSMFQLIEYKIPFVNLNFDEKNHERMIYKIRLDPKFKVTLNEETKEHYGSIELKVIIRGYSSKEKNRKVRELSLLIIGQFKGFNFEKDLFEKLLYQNGVANLIMIIRSFVISLTSQLGYGETVVIPLLNIATSSNLNKKHN